MKAVLTWLITLCSATMLCAGTVKLADGTVTEGEIQKIEDGFAIYKNESGKMVTVKLDQLVSYTKVKLEDEMRDNPESFADYTITRLELKVPGTTLSGKTADKNAAAQVKFSIIRKRSPGAKTIPEQARTPYVCLYMMMKNEKPKDKTNKNEDELKPVILTYPKSFRSRSFALDKNERVKVLSDSRRQIYKFTKNEKNLSEALKSENDMEFDIPVASKFKDASLQAYRFEIWGLNADAPLEVKEWKAVNFTPENNWWLNAK